MSYVRWNERSHELLNQWAVKITTNLVVKNRHADVIALMACLNNFDFLKQMPKNFHEINRDANDWLSMKLHVLASDLNHQNWNDASNNQQILRVVDEISEFLTINQFDSNSIDSESFPQRLQIPAKKSTRIFLDF